MFPDLAVLGSSFLAGDANNCSATASLSPSLFIFDVFFDRDDFHHSPVDSSTCGRGVSSQRRPQCVISDNAIHICCYGATINKSSVNMSSIS